MEVEFVGILEIGQDNLVYNQNNVTGSLLDGDSFAYESSIDDFSGDSNEIPKAIQLNILAVNSIGQQLINFFAIAFTNDCDTYPTLEVGGSAGWTRFVSTNTHLRQSSRILAMY